MAKKNPMMQVGGALLFLGALIYLYVYFTWYGSGYAGGAWLSAAQFLAPFVVAVALFSAVTLFFMGIGTMSGKTSKDPKMAMSILWKFIMAGSVTFLIITGGTAWYYWVVLALLLTYLGGMFSSEM